MTSTYTQARTGLSDHNQHKGITDSLHTGEAHHEPGRTILLRLFVEIRMLPEHPGPTSSSEQPSSCLTGRWAHSSHAVSSRDRGHMDQSMYHSEGSAGGSELTIRVAFFGYCCGPVYSGGLAIRMIEQHLDVTSRSTIMVIGISVRLGNRS